MYSSKFSEEEDTSWLRNTTIISLCQLEYCSCQQAAGGKDDQSEMKRWRKKKSEIKVVCPPITPAVSKLWKERGREKWKTPEDQEKHLISCLLWPWHMHPHEYWPFCSAFQHVFETSGESFALICCWHSAVHIFCNRCALQMSSGLKQKFM